MPADTKDNVKVTSAGWTLISSAEIQTLQVLDGEAGIIYATAQPADTVKVGERGHVLQARTGESYLANSTGGTSYGRASSNSGVAFIGLTEG